MQAGKPVAGTTYLRLFKKLRVTRTPLMASLRLVVNAATKPPCVRKGPEESP